MSSTTTRVDFEVDEGTNLSFDLSPDGSRIVFDLLGQLWLLPSEGGTATPLTDAARDRAEDVEPAFSPDGSTIAFLGYRRDGAGVFRIPSRGGVPERLTSEAVSRDLRNRAAALGPHLSPAWSPDGRQLMYALPESLYRLDVATRAVEAVSISLPALSGTSAYLGSAEWSSGGDRIVFGTGGGLAFRLYTGPQSSIWDVRVEGGTARRLTPEEIQAVAPAISPAGRQIAYFAHDDRERWQLWIQDLESGSRSMLTAHDDTTIRRVRWDPSGESLVYSADGHLWRVSSTGGQPAMIPFVARVAFDRARTALPPIRFPEPGSTEQAHSLVALAISHDGSRVALLSLGALWVGPLRGPVRRVAPMPDRSADLAWTPDDKEVLLTDSDVLAVDAGSGKVRRLTQLEGAESAPSLSPDGSHLAFLHQGRLRVARVSTTVLSRLDETLDLGAAAAPLGAGSPVMWSADSRSLLVFTESAAPRPDTAVARLVSLDGTVKTLAAVPHGAAFVQWDWSRGLVYSLGNQLWRAPLDVDAGRFGEPRAASERPALYLSIARDGAVLYVSEGGLQLRTPSGTEETLGWPVRYDVKPPARPLLITNARVIDGTGAPPANGMDILVEGGRIRAVGPSGTLRRPDGVEILDAAGRVVMPGLIDLHRHLILDRRDVMRQLAGALYYGTTTIRDAGSLLAQSADVRDLVRSGAWSGARAVLGGYEFDGFESGSGLGSDADQRVTDFDQIARGVAIARAFGAEYVKHKGMSEAWEGTIAAAHAHGMRISGHCSSLLMAMAAGVDGQEHAGTCFRDMRAPLYDDLVRLKTASDLWVVVTAGNRLDFLRVFDTPGILERPDFTPFIPLVRRPSYQGQSRSVFTPSFRREHVRLMAQAARYREAGVRIATGSDGSTPDAVHSELQALVEAGFTPLEAITAGTQTAAQVLGAGESLGTVEAGKIADLVILDADPLTDIRNTKRIWTVIQGGHIVDRPELVARVRSLPDGM